MAKKHIVCIGYMHYAFDSIKAATDCLVLLGKATLCERNYADGKIEYTPNEAPHRSNNLELTLNQNFREPRKAKTEKPLALPKPKRGSILCICERSSVAPGETCTHCGRSFSESHNRTHGTSESQPKLRLI
jgi:hypothetical protein